MSTAERMTLLALFQAQLGYTFQNVALLEQSLTHRSYAHEVAGNQADYERLEFLGDAVLGLMIGTYLYTEYPLAREGQLSQLRAYLVQQQTLASLARQFDLGRFLLLGRGEHQCGGHDKDSLLAAAFEAVVAAVYLDSGLLKTQEVFGQRFMSVIAQCAATRPDRDYKGVLQTQTLNAFGCTPTYQVVREEGPAHQKTFYVQLTLNPAYGCVGIGRSKKAAEQQAAKQLLALLEQTRT